jgi:hypothetical protein
VWKGFAIQAWFNPGLQKAASLFSGEGEAPAEPLHSKRISAVLHRSRHSARQRRTFHRRTIFCIFPFPAPPSRVHFDSLENKQFITDESILIESKDTDVFTFNQLSDHRFER